MNARFISLLCSSLAVGLNASASVAFLQSTPSVPCYDFVEITLRIDSPPPGNPFLDATITGSFARDQEPPLTVDGFCDSDDGSLFRIRFLPTQPGPHHYSIRYKRGEVEANHSGEFTALPSSRKGLVRVDPKYPFHFLWEGTGEHFFWNATTTYALIGWRDEKVIRESIDRLARLQVNRLRVAIVPPRVRGGQQWFEPAVTNDTHFTFCVNAWPAAHPDSVDDPKFDTSRFNLAHWRRFENLLRHAREQDVIISVIFYVDGRLPGVDPFKKDGMGGPEEQRYYRYAAARFAPFSNVMWDVSNEYRLFRTDAWAEQMGAFLKQCDPYDHLTSVHGHETFNFRASAWADFAMYQHWDEHGGFDFMLKNRRTQEQTGRLIPQINEEYGYEDHYPRWGGARKWPARTADNRRRLAWEMTLAGAYQTTGERADVPGCGGWITGRGNTEMTLLEGHAHLVRFFTSMEWWKLEPHPDLITEGHARCLADPGRSYVVYLPEGGTAKVKLAPGEYRIRGYNPRSGEWLPESDARAQGTPILSAIDQEDWVFLLQSRRPFR